VRVPRTEFELANALRDQLVILRDALEKLSSDFAHMKTVAGVLRVLVYDKGHNTPLLLSLAEKKKDKLFVKLEGPPALQATLPLKDFFTNNPFC
jgi:hypothetical protein